MLIVTTEYTLEPNNLENFLKTLEDLANFVLAHNTGCHRMEIGVSRQDKTKVFLYRMFKSQKNSDKFNNTEKWQELVRLKNDVVIFENTQSWEQLNIRPMILSY